MTTTFVTRTLALVALVAVGPRVPENHACMVLDSGVDEAPIATAADETSTTQAPTTAAIASSVATAPTTATTSTAATTSTTATTTTTGEKLLSVY